VIATRPDKPICYPPAPLNGGPLEHAPAKVGEWVWQPKVDDWRAVIHTPTRTIWNQYGQLSSFTQTDKFAVALDRIAVVSFAAEWLDVGLMENRHNMMRGCIVVLDLIGSPSSKQSWPFHERRAHLEAMFGVLPAATRIVGTPEAKDSVLLIPSFSGPDHLDGLRLYRGCIAQNEAIGQKFYEGVVAKRADSLYPIQLNRPKAKCPDWIKHRFDQ
jgi:hypothetical protein